jgi:hypothetical protein
VNESPVTFSDGQTVSAAEIALLRVSLDAAALARLLLLSSSLPEGVTIDLLIHRAVSTAQAELAGLGKPKLTAPPAPEFPRRKQVFKVNTPTADHPIPASQVTLSNGDVVKVYRRADRQIASVEYHGDHVIVDGVRVPESA